MEHIQVLGRHASASSSSSASKQKEKKRSETNAPSSSSPPTTATTTLQCDVAASLPSPPRTAHERLNLALQTEPRFAEEVALGRRVGAYKFIKDIGRGNFSKVKLATHQLTRDNVAVKIVDRARLDARAQRMLSSEVLTLESMHHPNVLRLFEVIEMWNRVYLVTEFVAGGELYNKISLDGPVQEEQAAVLFRQLIDAVKYMVSERVINRSWRI